MTENDKQHQQKHRLETLVDVIYGVVIVLLVTEFPTPLSEDFQGNSLIGFVVESFELIIGQAIALFVVVMYWLQSNAVNGILSQTDNRHSALVISQLILMLLYFYSTALSEQLGHTPPALALQSGALALMGIVGILGLAYASGKRRLLQAGVSASDIRNLRASLIPEPLTALLTLPAAMLGPDAWSLAWLSYPLVVFVVRRFQNPGGDPPA